MTQQNPNISDVTSADMADKGESQGIDWIEILTVLWRSRKLITYVTSSTTIEKLREGVHDVITIREVCLQRSAFCCLTSDLSSIMHKDSKN